MKRQHVLAIVLMLMFIMLLTGCSPTSSSENSSGGTQAEQKAEPKINLKLLYNIDDSSVVEDTVTGDLLLATDETTYGPYTNRKYVIYKYRDDMNTELVSKLKRDFGYVDPYDK